MIPRIKSSSSPSAADLRRGVFVQIILATLLLTCATTGCNDDANASADTSTPLDGASDASSVDPTDADTNDVTPTTPRWRTIDAAALPAGRWGQEVAAIDDSTALVFSGVDTENELLGGLWRVETTSDGVVSAQKIDTVGTPTPRYCGCMAYDSSRDALLLVGGRSFMDSFAETWRLDLNTGGWEQLSEGAGPEGPIGCSMAYSVDADAFYLFGGANQQQGTLDKTWRFDPETGTWTLIEGVGPSARYDAGMLPMSDGASLVLFSGAVSGFSGFIQDAWSFDTREEAWTRLNTSGESPIGRRTPWMLLSADERELFIGFGISEEQSGLPLGDLWSLDLALGVWSKQQLTEGDAPPPRGYSQPLPGGAPGRALLMGGYDLTSVTSDAWLLTTD